MTESEASRRSKDGLLLFLRIEKELELGRLQLILPSGERRLCLLRPESGSLPKRPSTFRVISSRSSAHVSRASHVSRILDDSPTARASSDESPGVSGANIVERLVCVDIED